MHLRLRCDFREAPTRFDRGCSIVGVALRECERVRCGRSNLQIADGARSGRGDGAAGTKIAGGIFSAVDHRAIMLAAAAASSGS
jgi:hypothetical protein